MSLLPAPKPRGFNFVALLNSIEVIYDQLPYSQANILFDKLTNLIDTTKDNIPKKEIKDYLNEYIELKERELSAILNNESIKISVWRTKNNNRVVK